MVPLKRTLSEGTANAEREESDARAEGQRSQSGAGAKDARSGREGGPTALLRIRDGAPNELTAFYSDLLLAPTASACLRRLWDHAREFSPELSPSLEASPIALVRALHPQDGPPAPANRNKQAYGATYPLR